MFDLVTQFFSSIENIIFGTLVLIGVFIALFESLKEWISYNTGCVAVAIIVIILFVGFGFVVFFANEMTNKQQQIHLTEQVATQQSLKQTQDHNFRTTQAVAQTQSAIIFETQSANETQQANSNSTATRFVVNVTLTQAPTATAFVATDTARKTATQQANIYVTETVSVRASATQLHTNNLTGTAFATHAAETRTQSPIDETATVARETQQVNYFRATETAESHAYQTATSDFQTQETIRLSYTSTPTPCTIIRSDYASSNRLQNELEDIKHHVR